MLKKKLFFKKNVQGDQSWIPPFEANTPCKKESRPSQRCRYGLVINHENDLNLVHNRILKESTIKSYCFQKKKVIVNYKKRVHYSRFKRLKEGLALTEDLKPSKSGSKLTKLYPSKDGWIHINRELENPELSLKVIKKRIMQGETLLNIRKDLLRICDDSYVTCIENHSTLSRFEQQVQRDREDKQE